MLLDCSEGMLLLALLRTEAHDIVRGLILELTNSDLLQLYPEMVEGLALRIAVLEFLSIAGMSLLDLGSFSASDCLH